MKQTLTDFPDNDLISAAGTGNVDAAVRLDSLGFILKPDETPSAFAKRISAIRKTSAELAEKFGPEGGPCEVYPGITISPKNRIPQEIIQEASEITQKAYGFSVSWVPGWFPDHELGILWGGCAISDEEEDSIPVFIIRGSFRNRRKWFIYDRSELLSHELSHAVRMPLHDRPLEEHFAYALSKSLFRRTTGNCFQADWDAILFLVPVLLLLAVQILINIFGLTFLPAWPFWCIAFVWPVFLLSRNFYQTRHFCKAARNIAKAGFRNPNAVLYRCLSSETFRFAEMTPEKIREYVQQKAETELRWKVILKRFFTAD